MRLSRLAPAVALAVTLLPAPALAIVRARDAETGQPLRLRDREIALTLSATHASRDLPTEAVMAALRRAAARWTTDVGCTGVTFSVLPPSLAADRARRDGVNTVLFHEQAWCRDGVRTRFSCYDREEQAMTTTYLDRSAPSGEVLIAEADVEINAVDYRWTTAAAPSSNGAEPLEELLVHELGHVLGLAHGCDDGTLPDGAVDERGARPARCPTEPRPPLPAMAPAPSAALLPVALTPDERRAVCELYPVAPPPGRAARGCGCAIGARRAGDERTGAALLALGALALALGRRSRRSGVPSCQRRQTETVDSPRSRGPTRTPMRVVAAGPSRHAPASSPTGCPPSRNERRSWLPAAVHLLSCGFLAAAAVGCGEPDKGRPCVPGVEGGDVLGARVLEVYDSASTFEYDLAEFFGPDSGEEAYQANCNAERDLVLGETIVIDVVQRHDSWSQGPCSTVGLSVRDTEMVEMGTASMVDVRGSGSVLLGVAVHCCTSVDGCSRSWIGSFLVHHGAGPFDPAVPGEVPPVLLRRAMAPTDSTCTTYVEPVNVCLFVLELEKL